MFFYKQVSSASDTDTDNLHDPSDNPHDLSSFYFPPVEGTSCHMNCIVGRSVERKCGVCPNDTDPLPPLPTTAPAPRANVDNYRDDMKKVFEIIQS